MNRQPLEKWLEQEEKAIAQMEKWIAEQEAIFQSIQPTDAQALFDNFPGLREALQEKTRCALEEEGLRIKKQKMPPKKLNRRHRHFI